MSGVARTSPDRVRRVLRSAWAELGRATRLLFLAVGALSLVGCVAGAPAIDDEVGAAEWELRPMRLHAETELHFGRTALGLVSSLASFADDPDIDHFVAMLRDVDAVHLGVYEIDGSAAGAGIPTDFGPGWRAELADLGWRVVVHARDRDESQWVLIRDLDELLLVQREDDELVVVKVEGDLGAILDTAIRRDDEWAMAVREFES